MHWSKQIRTTPDTNMHVDIYAPENGPDDAIPTNTN